MREELGSAIEVAKASSHPAPSNEAETCQRIIYPLLLAAGYGHLEIKSQDLDAAKQKPDYTILPDVPEHTWFLEAKAWNLNLNDDNAVQAINYANTQGKRWVVLSNGREWRLYDNHIIGTADLKHAATAHLTDEGFGSFLDALCKSSILGGKLDVFVRNQRLYTALGSQIAKPDSDVLKAIVKVLRSSPGLSSVSASDVMGYFANQLQRHSPEPSPPTPDVFEPQVVPASAPRGEDGSVRFRLDEQFDFRFTAKPTLSWKDKVFQADGFASFMEVVLAHLLDRGFAFPEDAEKDTGVYFTRDGSVAKSKMRAPVYLGEMPHGIWYEKHRSATNHILMLKRLMILNSQNLQDCVVEAISYK